MFKTFLSRFRRSEGGATTVEFMIAMPLIVFWFGGTFTFFQGYSEWTRSLKATYTVADILSRQLEVDDDYMEDMNTLFASIMGADTNDTWLRVSSIEMTEDGLDLVWSDATGLHFNLASNEEIPVEIIPNLVEGETVLLVESRIPVVPFQDYIGISSRTVTNQIAVSPRFNSQTAWLD